MFFTVFARIMLAIARLPDRAVAREDLSSVRHVAWCDGKVNRP